MPRANGITRQEILSCLKIDGPRTADELARELCISQVAVRQHLASLEAEGSISVQVERKGLGRPSHRYRLTEQGDESFPRRYSAFADELLSELKAWQGETAVNELLARRRERLYRPLRTHLLHSEPADKSVELVRLLTEQGFMAESCKAGSESYVLVKRNCALGCIAKKYPDACCKGDMPLYEQVLGGAGIKQEKNIHDGDPSCVFYVTRAPQPGCPPEE